MNSFWLAVLVIFSLYLIYLVFSSIIQYFSQKLSRKGNHKLQFSDILLSNLFCFFDLSKFFSNTYDAHNEQEEKRKAQRLRANQQRINNFSQESYDQSNNNFDLNNRSQLTYNVAKSMILDLIKENTKIRIQWLSAVTSIPIEVVCEIISGNKDCEIDGDYVFKRELIVGMCEHCNNQYETRLGYCPSCGNEFTKK